MPPTPGFPHRGLLTERIARALEHDIRTGVLAAGDKLPSERELAVTFAASRNVVREVLRRLEAQHLIEVAAGRGSFVSSPALAESQGFDAVYRASRPTVRQLIEARLPLEVESAGLAAQRASHDDLASLEAAHQAVLRAPDAVQAARADLSFHEMIAITGRNPVLRIMLLSIGPMMFEMMLRSNSDPSIAEPGVPHHAEILAAIAAHDVDLARRCMREHLSMGLRTYGEDLDEQLTSVADRQLDTLLQRPV